MQYYFTDLGTSRLFRIITVRRRLVSHFVGLRNPFPKFAFVPAYIIPRFWTWSFSVSSSLCSKRNNTIKYNIIYTLPVSETWRGGFVCTLVCSLCTAAARWYWLFISCRNKIKVNVYIIFHTHAHTYNNNIASPIVVLYNILFSPFATRRFPRTLWRDSYTFNYKKSVAAIVYWL